MVWKVFDFGFAVARLSVKVFVGDVFGVKARLDEAEHFGEAGEDEDFVRAGFFFDVFQEQVEFDGVVAVVFAVGEQRRAVADLPQFEQAFEDVQLAFFDAVGGDFVEQLFAVAVFWSPRTVCVAPRPCRSRVRFRFWAAVRSPLVLCCGAG